MPAFALTHARTSLLARVFLVNVTVVAAAIALLAFTPITITAPVITVAEAALLAAGGAFVLALDLVLVRRTLTPLRELTESLATRDPRRPASPLTPGAGASAEVAALTDAFNALLDRLEHERRDRARDRLRTQEDERLRIARELHDEIGQTLTAVALHAERMARAPVDALPGALREVATSVRSSLDDVRRIARELRPEALDDLGLVNALITLCERVALQSGVEIRRRFTPPPPQLDPNTELVVYRVAQEALTNALRHSEAHEVHVSLVADAGGALLTVEDDGRGLPTPLTERGGIVGMRERASLVNGHLTLDTAVEHGTVIRLSIP